MATPRPSLAARLRAGLAALIGPGRWGGPTGGDLREVLHCTFEATAACLDQAPRLHGDLLRHDAALAHETAARLGLTTKEAAALYAALLLTRIDSVTLEQIAIPDAVQAQRNRAASLRSDAGVESGSPARTPTEEASTRFPGSAPTTPPATAGPRIDPLTRLPLLRFLFGSFEQDLRRAESQGKPLSLIQIDIDDFGRLNERYGSAAGDRVLRGVARAIRSTLRPSDTCVRCAGDAFVITVPGVGPDGIAAVLARVETAVGRHKFVVARGLSVQVGVTMGAATFPADGRAHEALLAVAEARRLDRLLARRRRPEDAGRHLRFPGRRDTPVN
jgi:diguanylate cyclase (GGDEF)-like protein